MNKLIWAGALLLSIFLGDRLIGAGFRQIMFSSQFRYSQMYKGGLDAEVLIIGNSRGVNSFYQPALEDLLGKEVINMSYNGLRMDIARVLIEDYLSLNNPPKTILLEASVLSKAYPELIKEFKPYAAPSTALQRKLAEAYPQEAMFSSISHLFALNSELFLRSLYYLNRDDQNWINQGTIDEASVTNLKKYKGSRFEVSEALLQDVKEVYQLCQSQNIELKLVLSPYLPAYAAKILNLEEWKAEITTVVEGIEVLDHAAVITGREYFADWVHLNKKGSKVYLQYLLENNILH